MPGAIVQAQSTAKAAKEVSLEFCKYRWIVCMLLEAGPNVLLQQGVCLLFS